MGKKTVILITTDSLEVSKELAKVNKLEWGGERIRGPRMSDDTIGIMYDMSKSWKYPMLIGLAVKGDELEVKRVYVGVAKPGPNLKGLLYSMVYSTYRSSQAKKVLTMILDRFHGHGNKGKPATMKTQPPAGKNGKNGGKTEVVTTAVGPPGQAVTAALDAAASVVVNSDKKKGQKKVKATVDVKTTEVNTPKKPPPKPKGEKKQPAQKPAGVEAKPDMTDQQFAMQMAISAEKGSGFHFLKKLSAKKRKGHLAKWIGSAKDEQEKALRKGMAKLATEALALERGEGGAVAHFVAATGIPGAGKHPSKKAEKKAAKRELLAKEKAKNADLMQALF